MEIEVGGSDFGYFIWNGIPEGYTKVKMTVNPSLGYAFLGSDLSTGRMTLNVEYNIADYLLSNRVFKITTRGNANGKFEIY